jgi:hypothetical protein
VPTSTTACPGTAPVSSVCYELDNELIATSTIASGKTVTFTTAVSDPIGQGNGYQTSAAQVILTVHAVQSAHNTLSCTTVPAAGQRCIPNGSFLWS